MSKDRSGGTPAPSQDPTQSKAPDPGSPASSRAELEAFLARVNTLDSAVKAGGRFAEHLGLQHAGLIPGRLPAHGRIKRKNQPSAPAGLDRRVERVDASEERLKLRA